MKKLGILLVMIAVYGSKSEPLILLDHTVKGKEHKGLYKISCPVQKNTTEQPDKNCICKTILVTIYLVTNTFTAQVCRLWVIIINDKEKPVRLPLALSLWPCSQQGLFIT